MKSYAFAKLNLALKILGQRPDGYHSLDMLMQRISLCDELTIRKSEALTVTSDLPLPADNTMTRAARHFFAYTGIVGGADISVVKNIPAEAGLGGGSSDGAAVLTALNRLYAAGLTETELICLGQKVGADVPFFMVSGCARAMGTGEILTPVPNNLKCVYLLAKPRGGVGTKEAYELYHACPKQNIDMDRAVAAVAAGSLAEYALHAGNDLAPAAMRLCPDIVKILGEMRGAETALVTGSGSCAFGLYADKKTALANMERLRSFSFVDFVYVAENK